MKTSQRIAHVGFADTFTKGCLTSRRQPTPGGRFGFIVALLARRGCAARSAMRHHKSNSRSFAPTWTAFCLSLLLCGCATVEPELTPEERVYNQQLKEQGEAHEPSALDDCNTAQKILAYTLWPAMIALKALGEGRV